MDSSYIASSPMPTYELVHAMDKTKDGPMAHINMAELVKKANAIAYAHIPTINLPALIQAQNERIELEDQTDLYAAATRFMDAQAKGVEEGEALGDIQNLFTEPQTSVVEVAQPQVEVSITEPQPQAQAVEAAQPAEPQTEVSAVRSESAEPTANERRIDSEIMKARAARPAGKRPPTNRRDLAGRATIVTLAEPTPKEEAPAAAPAASVPPVVAKRAQGKIAGLANALGGGIKIQLPGQGMPARRVAPAPTTSCSVEANQTNPKPSRTPPIRRA